MNKLFISDLHLDMKSLHRLEKLDELLNWAVRNEYEIYILGDLVELWVGDDDNGDLANKLRDTLLPHGRGTQMYLMHGNRDFLLGEQFASDVQAELLDDPSVIDLGGSPTLLAHGDTFCTSDKPYQQMRAMFRSKTWQSEFLSQRIEERHEFANSVREASRNANANKAESITDVVEDSVRQALREYSCTTVIHGHTHRPGIHDLGDGMTRYVLGAWEKCGWFAQFMDDLTLECFALEGKPL